MAKEVEVWYCTDFAAAQLRGLDMFATSDARVAGLTFMKVADLVLPSDDDGTVLELAFRRMNVVDGNELPNLLGIRSMCMGDIAVIGENAYLCEAMGWMVLLDFEKEEA